MVSLFPLESLNFLYSLLFIVPDLAFSEMEFLRRSNRETDHRQEKPPPKSRKNDRRREEKTFNEITSYFKAGKEPLAEVAVNRQQYESSPAKGHPGKTVTPFGRQQADWNRGDSASRRSSMPDPTDFLEKPFLGFGRQASIPDKFRAPETRTPRREFQRVTDTASRISGPATTCMTWTESIISPNVGIHSARPQRSNEPERSSTPESIRQAIARTGVFRDTGLQRRISSSGNEEIKARLRKLQQDAKKSSRSDRIASGTGSPRSTRTTQTTGLAQQFDLSRFRADMPQTTVEPAREPVKRVEISKITPPRLEIHHYDQNLGWHQDNAEAGQDVRHTSKDTVPSEPLRPNRRELAKTAYVKPAVKTTSKDAGSHDAGKETSANLAIAEPSKIIRPATAPPKTNIPTVSRPHLAAQTSGGELPSHTIRSSTGAVAEQEPMSIPSLAPQSWRPSQEPHYQRVEDSLPPLTDRISASSITRTGSTQSTQNAQVYQRLPLFEEPLAEKPPADHLSLPIRGAWPGQSLYSPPVVSASLAILNDSLYGQQVEREHANGLRNGTLSPTFNDNLLLNQADIDFEREEQFIQGLSHNFQGVQNVDDEYLEFRDYEPGIEVDNNLDYAIQEDNGEYYEQHQPFDGNFGNDIESYDYLEGGEYAENQGNGYAVDEGFGLINYEARSYELYPDERQFRRDVVEDQAEDSLAGFWRPHRQY